MMLREIEHPNFPSRESIRILVSIVNRLGTKLQKGNFENNSFKIPMIVSIVLNKVADKFLTSSSYSSVKIHFKVNFDVLIYNYLNILYVKILARPRSVPTRWNG